MMQYQLMERTAAASQTTWLGTEQFTLPELATFLSNARNRFMVETGQLVDRSLINGPMPPAYQVDMPDYVIDLRRVAFFDGVTYQQLFDEDEWSLTSLISDWTNQSGTPTVYTILAERPLQLAIAPPPNVNSQLELITTRTIDSFTPQSVATSVRLLNNYASYAKWGALVDLLIGDGQATDETRAGVAQRRFSEGVELAKMNPIGTYFELNGVAVPPCAVFEMDSLIAGGWQNTSGQPNTLGIEAQNMIALSPVPDAGPYSVRLAVARNAPTPTADGDFLQIGREELEVIYDYAQHLAMFKVGGVELARSEEQVKTFYSAALLFNARLSANAYFAKTVFGLGMDEEAKRPRVAGMAGATRQS